MPRPDTRHAHLGPANTSGLPANLGNSVSQLWSCVVGHVDCEFTQFISVGVLEQLVRWTSEKEKELKSRTSAGVDISPLHADSTCIIHLVIRQYDKSSNIPTTSTGNVEWQLKADLPLFCNIKRSLRSLNVVLSNCCSLAKCLYVSTEAGPRPQTSQERMSKLRRENLDDFRGREQARDTSCLLYTSPSPRD